MKTNTITRLLSEKNWVVVSKPLARKIGLNAAYLFAHLVGLFEHYERTGELVERDGKNWFFATLDDVETDTGLSRKEQDTSIAKLCDLGLIHKKAFGVPARRFIAVGEKADDILTEIIAAPVCTKVANQFVQNGQTGLDKKDKPDGLKGANPINNTNITRIIDNNEKTNVFSYTANAEEKKAAPEIKQPTSEPNDQTATAGEKEKSCAKKEKAAEAELFQTEPADKKRFAPPTVDEVAAYCAERGNKINAANFVDFYISKGWYVGKNKMKDWKAAVRTWERSQQPNNQNQNFSNNNSKIEITNEAARNYVERTYDRTY